MNSWNYVLRQIESRRLRQALLPSVRTRLGTDGVLRNNKRCPSTSSLVFFNTQFRPWRWPGMILLTPARPVKTSIDTARGGFEGQWRDLFDPWPESRGQEKKHGPIIVREWKVNSAHHPPALVTAVWVRRFHELQVSDDIPDSITWPSSRRLGLNRVGTAAR